MLSQASSILAIYFAGWCLDKFSDNFMGYNIVFIIALIAGLTAISMIRKIPEHSSTTQLYPEHFPKFFNLVKEPLRNKNFRKYLIFSTIYGAGGHILAPFMVIYMNKTLMLSKTLISTYTIIWSVTYIVFMKIWGHFADKFGNKPILTISVWGASIGTFLWLFATPNGHIIIPVIYFVKGIFFSGFILASMNLLLNITPAQHKSMYISNYQFIRSLFAGLAPIAGGYFLMINLSGLHINLSNIHFLCIISGSISIFSALLLTRVETCKEKSTVYVLKQIISLNPIKTIIRIFLPYRSPKENKDS
jgi:MFS family permease